MEDTSVHWFSSRADLSELQIDASLDYIFNDKILFASYLQRHSIAESTRVTQDHRIVESLSLRIVYPTRRCQG